MSSTYKKMAGTSAVFILASHQKATPVERDGMAWNAQELHLASLPTQRQRKPSMANALALEGLEDYDKPSNGDLRHVESLALNFIYFERIQGWVQI